MVAVSGAHIFAYTLPLQNRYFHTNISAAQFLLKLWMDHHERRYLWRINFIIFFFFFSYMSWNCLHRKNFAMRKTIWSFARKNINAPKNVLLFPRFIGSHPVNTQRFFILSRRFQRQNILQIVHNVCVIISFFAGQKSHVSVANQARNYSNWITINTIERMMN